MVGLCDSKLNITVIFSSLLCDYLRVKFQGFKPSSKFCELWLFKLQNNICHSKSGSFYFLLTSI